LGVKMNQVELPQCNRREFLRMLGCSALLLGGATISNAKTKQRPNIIFILTDDQRFDAMGCAGNPLIRTPNIDSLAARGVRFDHAYVTCAVCSPSRAACLTGRYGSANGVTTLDRPLNKGELTFAHFLARAGYQTGCIGKWHLDTPPAECGFNTAKIFQGNGPYFNRLVEADGEKKNIPGFVEDYIAGQSLEFIRAALRKKAPFALWMCTQLPHMTPEFDWDVREETLALYSQAAMPVPASWQDDLTGKPPYLKEGRSRLKAQQFGYAKKEAVQRHLQRYYGAVTEVDASIGRVLKAVQELGLNDNTWFILMGDNGWFLGEHGFTSKVLAYEESIHVPMIIAGPGLKHRVDKHLVLNIDLATTILDLAGIPVPANMHGKSLLPLLTGRDAKWRKSFLYEAPTPTLGSRPLMAVRTNKWKYIRTYDIEKPSSAEFEELYDMENDAIEMKNLAGDKAYAGIVRHLAAELERLRGSLKDKR